ncbi:MAG: hypothetical protein H6741_25145 [Alphaproteobacteria bacterium]|nr:hypothetical protein [Alphaproteobacteria bacterium]MCB9795996.1 hypothetical protein [Alphaproteobacteria bacterium]
MLLLTLALACADKAHTPDDSRTDDSAPAGLTAVLSTASDDYAVGALATVDAETWALRDNLTDLTGDTVLVASGGYVFRVDRYNYDVVSAYTPGDWGEPLSELALADQANPHDVAVCEGLAFVTQYGRAELAVFEPGTGLLSGVVDLSDYADADGIPEASTLVEGPPGKLYVGLQNLDQDNGWVNVGGHVLEIDCAGRRVSQAWETSGSADIYPHREDALLVSVLGEGLRALDLGEGALGPVLFDAAAAGEELVGLASDGQRVAAATVDADYNYNIGCIDLSDGSYALGEATPNYLIQVAGDPEGRAWFSARRHWSDPEGPAGLRVYDIASCSSLAPEGLLQTSLAPFSVAFY